jgi:hypothetical protein
MERKVKCTTVSCYFQSGLLYFSKNSLYGSVIYLLKTGFKEKLAKANDVRLKEVRKFQKLSNDHNELQTKMAGLVKQVENVDRKKAQHRGKIAQLEVDVVHYQNQMKQ